MPEITTKDLLTIIAAAADRAAGDLPSDIAVAILEIAAETEHGVWGVHNAMRSFLDDLRLQTLLLAVDVHNYQHHLENPGAEGDRPTLTPALRQFAIDQAAKWAPLCVEKAVG